MSEAILEAEDIVVGFPGPRTGLFGRRATVSALANVSVSVRPGETLGIVGESGCGKSTLGRVLTDLERQTDGTVRFMGKDVSGLKGRERVDYRTNVQFIFQDSGSALDPRKRVGESIGEGLTRRMLAGRGRDDAIAETLLQVGLQPEAARRFPHEFSGGQRQRIAIARAIIRNPKVIVADEPIAALDVSVQATIVNLLVDICRENGLSLIFISHNLSMVGYLSDSIAVMYLGKVVEFGEARAIMEDPRHPYTRALLSAVPSPDPSAEPLRSPLTGEVPSALDPPSGCRFRTRCPFAEAICADKEPELLTDGLRDGATACHFPGVAG